MASRTQMRLAQITGSFGNAPGQISDQRQEQAVAGAPNAAALLMSSGSLLGPMSEMASAIKRIHGGDQFAAAAPGQFFVDIQSANILPDAQNNKNLGSALKRFANLHLGTSINLDGYAITSIKDEDDMASDSAAALATQRSIKKYVDDVVTAQDLDGLADGSTEFHVDLDSQNLSILGGTGLTSAGLNQSVTINLDNTSVTAADYGVLADDDKRATFSVDAQGRLTAAGNRLIDIAHTQVNDFDAGVRTNKVHELATPSDTFSMGTQKISDLVDPTNAQDAATKAYVDAQDLDFQADSGGALSIDLDSEALSILGGVALSSVGSGNGVTINLNDTSVAASSQGTATNVSTFTVDAQGRLTAAGNVAIAIPAAQVTNFSEAVDDRVDALSVAGEGMVIAYDDSAGTLTFSGQDSAAGNKGIVIVAGTANEVDVAYASGTATVGLPNDVTISGDLIVSANLTVNGEQFKIDGETVVMNDTLMEMGTQGASNLPPTSATTKDLGLLLHRWDATESAAHLQFMGWDESAAKFIMRSDVTETSGSITDLGAAAALEVGAFDAGASTLASVTVTGASVLNGTVALGSDVNDLISPNGVFAGDLVPTGANRKLGSPSVGSKWAELHVAGEAIIDNLKLDGNTIISTDANGNINLTPNGTGEVNISKVDIDGGSIDATDVTVGAGKTLDVSAGTLTLANDQISGDKVEGGTIAGITISSLVATTADINGGTIDGSAINASIIGGATPAAGTFSALIANTSLVAATADINGGTIDGASIGATVRQSGAFTTLEANGNMVFGNDAADNIAMNGTIIGQDALRFEGQTVDGDDLTIRVADPTAARQIILPDADGVFAVSALSSTGVSLTAAGQIQMGITGAAQHWNAPEDGDKLLLWDTSESAHKKVLLSQVRNYLAITYTQKAVFAAADLAAGQPLDVGAMASIDAGEWHLAAEVAQEVFCNGQLLARGANALAGMDWYKHSVSGQIKFAFDLEADDILQFVLRA